MPYKSLLVVIILIVVFSVPLKAQEFVYYNDSNTSNFKGYVQQLQRSIKSHVQSKQFERNYRVKIGLTLDKLGNVTDTRVLEPSKSNDFDYEMTSAILDSSPFKPLPYSFAGQSMAFIVEIIAQDVLITCQYATTDPRIVHQQRQREQEERQAQQQRLQQQRTLEYEKQRTQRQMKNTVNSVLRQFGAPVSF